MGGNVVTLAYDRTVGLAVRPEFYWDRNGRWTGSETVREGGDLHG